MPPIKYILLKKREREREKPSYCTTKHNFKDIVLPYHGLSLGIERTDKVRSILLLEPNTRPERMARIILKDTACSIINQDQTFLPAKVSQRQCADHIGSYGLDFMGFAPVDVRPASNAGSVENMSGINGNQVGFEGGSVFKATGTIGEVDALGLAKLA